MAYAIVESTIGALLRWNNLYGLIVLTLILTVIVVIIYKYTTNQQALKQLKEDGLKIREEMKLHKDNPQKLMELQKEQFRKGFIDQFKHTMMPMLITLVPMAVLFVYLKNFYESIGNPKLLFGFGWVFVYIVFSIIFNMIFRKLLKVY